MLPVPIMLKKNFEIYYYHYDSPIYHYGGIFHIFSINLVKWITRGTARVNYLTGHCTFSLKLPGVTREFSKKLPFSPEKGNG